MERLFGGLKLFIQPIYKDNRGYFTESFNKKRFIEENGKDVVFVQDNESCSKKFVVRGLHYQKGKYAQAKLVRVIKGVVIDFVLDIRKDAKTYGEMAFVLLIPGYQFFIPRGFAHGFISLEDDTIFSYKCDNFWNKEAESGYNILDDKLDIINKLNKYISSTSIYSTFKKEDLIFSDKDLTYPNFSK